MQEWTDAAQAELARHLDRVRAHAATAGADPDEVAGDLRRHIDAELAETGARIVTQEDVARILARLAAAEGPEPPPEEPPQAPPAPAQPAASAGPRHPLGTGGAIAGVLFGVILPAFTLGFEIVTGLCAEVFFDPIPSALHLLLVALVPLANLATIAALRGWTGARPRCVSWVNGIAIGVALYYALLFLPLTPFAAAGLVYFGAGLVPLTPLVSLIVASSLRLPLRRSARATGGMPRLRPRLALGMTLGFAALFLLDLPKMVTLVGLRVAVSEQPATRRRGVRMLRAIGSDDALLRSCYGVNKPVSDLVSVLIGMVGRPVPAERAREVYYRVTGVPYNAVKPPELRGLRRGALININDFDFDQAGDAVAARVRGLSLYESRLDGVIDPDAGTTYTEWTLVFRNESAQQREARAQVALPPGGVVSRLTLWIDGEEREAAYSGRSQVKEAYKRIVERRRDPVLVTTRGPDQVLVQCFPVPPDGGTMKAKIGITAPLLLDTPAEGLLRLPYFVEQNFAAAPDLEHAVWVESTRPLRAFAEQSPGMVAERAGAAHALRGRLADASFAAGCTIRAERDPAAVECVVAERLEPGHVIRQRIEPRPVAVPGRLVIVVDGSRRMRDAIAPLAEALEGLPAGMEAALLFAADQVVELAGPQPAGSDGFRRAARRLAGARYEGGCDNVPALVRAWDLAAAAPTGGAILWLHATQPIELSRFEELAQLYERRPGGPALYDYQLGSGPNVIAERLNGHSAFQRVPHLGEPAGDLARLFDIWSGRTVPLAYQRVREPGTAESGFDPRRMRDHVARLWAHDEVMRRGAAALDLAVGYRLVTPVSGAVVLETAQQYAQAGLEPADPQTVPAVAAVPEPATWLLIAVGLVLMGARRRRAQ